MTYVNDCQPSAQELKHPRAAHTSTEADCREPPGKACLSASLGDLICPSPAAPSGKATGQTVLTKLPLSSLPEAQP